MLDQKIGPVRKVVYGAELAALQVNTAGYFTRRVLNKTKQKDLKKSNGLIKRVFVVCLYFRVKISTGHMKSLKKNYLMEFHNSYVSN